MQVDDSPECPQGKGSKDSEQLVTNETSKQYQRVEYMITIEGIMLTDEFLKIKDIWIYGIFQNTEYGGHTAHHL